MVKTNFTDLVGIQWPIIQAPMIGGYSDPNMVAIVSNLGCLGTLALGNLSPDQIKQQCEQALSLSNKPIAANLFVRQNETIPKLDKGSDEIKALIPIYKQLSIDESVLFNQALSNLPELDSQIEAILSTDIPIVTFTFGIPSSEIVQALKQHNKVVIATATNLQEAKLIQEKGFDAVILQGINAGGHRASFITDGNEGLETAELLQQTINSLSIPIICTGAIMDGQQIGQYIQNGAGACQLGTAYLFTEEAKVESYYLKALVEHKEETCLSNSFTGKYARVIKNKFVEDMKDKQIAPFPYQGQLTSSIRTTASSTAQYEYLPFWAGSGYSQGRLRSAESLTKTLIKELLLSRSL